MWIKLVDVFLEPLINSWRAVKQIERDLIKGDGGPPCPASTRRFLRQRRCSRAAGHGGEHHFV